MRIVRSPERPAVPVLGQRRVPRRSLGAWAAALAAPAAGNLTTCSEVLEDHHGVRLTVVPVSFPSTSGIPPLAIRRSPTGLSTVSTGREKVVGLLPERASRIDCTGMRMHKGGRQ